MHLTVLYDAQCPLCRAFSTWLATQATFVPLDLVPAGTPEARRRFPELDHARTLEEVTVVAATGQVWTGAHAWVMCLWATATHRARAESLATPAGLPMARAAAYVAAGIRSATSTRDPHQGGGYPDQRACVPEPQG